MWNVNFFPQKTVPGHLLQLRSTHTSLFPDPTELQAYWLRPLSFKKVYYLRSLQEMSPDGCSEWIWTYVVICLTGILCLCWLSGGPEETTLLKISIYKYPAPRAHQFSQRRVTCCKFILMLSSTNLPMLNSPQNFVHFIFPKFIIFILILTKSII